MRNSTWLRSQLAQLRFAWIRLAGIALVGTVLVAGFVLSVRTSNLLSTLGNIASNVFASVMVAVVAILAFQLIVRFQLLRRLLHHQALALPPPGLAAGKRPNQARAIVAQLQDTRRAGGIFLEATTMDARESFIADLLQALSAAGIVGLVLRAGHYDVDLSRAASQRFELLLREAGASEVAAVPSLEWLMQRRRAVVIILDMDTTVGSGGREYVGAVVHRRADDLSRSGMPFIGIVDEMSLDGNEPFDKVKATPVDYVDVALDTPVLLTPDVVTHRSNPFLTAPTRKLAVALQRYGLHQSTVIRDGMSVEEQESLAAELETDGPVHFGLRILGVPLYLPYLRTAQTDSALPDRVLLRLVVQLIATDANAANLADLCDGLDEVDYIGFLLAMKEFESRGLLVRSHSNGQAMLAFTDQTVRDVAIGYSLAQHQSAYVLSKNRSAICMAIEAYHRITTSDSSAPIQWTSALNAFAASPFGLSAIAMTYCALWADGKKGFDVDNDWLSTLWNSSDPSERQAFVNQLPANASSKFAPFLWSRVTGDEIRKNPYALRRSVCRVLGSSGAPGWQTMEREWSQLVTETILNDELTWFGRPHTGSWRGSALASLCWVLPSMALTTLGASQLMRCLEDKVVPGGGRLRDNRPDIGIEISLAEGCKAACYLARNEGMHVVPAVIASIQRLLSTARSWYSRFVALQALVVASSVDQPHVRVASEACVARINDRSEHPLLRQYAALLLVPIGQLAAGEAAQLNQFIWGNDAEILAQAGGELNDDVVCILATIAVLLNFCEERHARSAYNEKDRESRILALTTCTLPQCLVRASAAAASTKAECRCPIGVCGTDVGRTSARRPLSTTFIYRCLAATGSGRVLVRSGMHRALKVHLDELSKLND